MVLTMEGKKYWNVWDNNHAFNYKKPTPALNAMSTVEVLQNSGGSKPWIIRISLLPFSNPVKTSYRKGGYVCRVSLPPNMLARGLPE